MERGTLLVGILAGFTLATVTFVALDENEGTPTAVPDTRLAEAVERLVDIDRGSRTIHGLSVPTQHRNGTRRNTSLRGLARLDPLAVVHYFMGERGNVSR